jgi:glutathione synthase/RimK-type ligase-like ATP-grasp enzyme
MDDNIAFLWWEDEVKWEKADKPFSKEWKSRDYEVYADLFEKRDIDFYAAEYRWLEEDFLRKAWYWNGDKWIKKHDIQVEMVYDLFRHDEEKMKLKKDIQNHVDLVNKPDVTDLCQDKLKTYNKFSNYVPETAEATEDNIRDLLDEYGEVVLKPRYGSAGEGIERIESIEELEGRETDDLLVQRFVSEPLLSEFDLEKFHDLRVIIINDEVLGGYLRLPEKEGFLSNVAQGASVKYLKTEEIPEKVYPMIDEVSDCFRQYSPVIYTVDFIFEDDEPLIMELNSQPGIFYHKDATMKEYEYPWMKKVVETLEENL